MKTDEIMVFDVMFQVSGHPPKILEVSEKHVGMTWDEWDNLSQEKRDEITQGVVVDYVKKEYPYCSQVYWCYDTNVLTLKKVDLNL